MDNAYHYAPKRTTLALKYLPCPFFGLTFLCLNVGVRNALAIGLVRRFDFLDDDIDQFSHWTSRCAVFEAGDGLGQRPGYVH